MTTDAAMKCCVCRNPCNGLLCAKCQIAVMKVREEKPGHNWFIPLGAIALAGLWAFALLSNKGGN